MRHLYIIFAIFLLNGLIYCINNEETTQSRILVGIGGALYFDEVIEPNGNKHLVQKSGDPYYFYEDDPDNKYFGKIPSDLKNGELYKLFEKKDKNVNKLD